MNMYVINIQFVNPAASFKEDIIKDAIIASTRNYNAKSLIAKNPKKIVNFSFSEDNTTLTINLESEAELPMPTKALRLFSSYLVEQTCLEKFLSGRQLFKMSVAHFPTNISDTTTFSDEDTTDIDMIEKLIQLRQKGHPGIGEIYSLINKYWKEDVL